MTPGRRHVGIKVTELDLVAVAVKQVECVTVFPEIPEVIDF